MSVSAADQPVFANEFAHQIDQLQIEIVTGGITRTQSVRNALDSLAGDASISYVAVHDAARPLVRALDLDAVFAAAMDCGAAMLATEIPGSVKRSDEENHAATVDRRDLWIALTPQVFAIDCLTEAYRKFRGRPATDDAELVERTGTRVKLVRGSADNIKITHPEDLTIANAILERQNHHA